MDLLKIQLEGRYLGRDIFLFIFYSDSTAFSSTKYVRVSYKRFYVKYMNEWSMNKIDLINIKYFNTRKVIGY